MKQYRNAMAVISKCGTWRYWLERDWRDRRDEQKRFFVFVMLNPSTADGKQDDPTIRRCVDFSMRLGGNGLIVVNLFAYRSSSPQVILSGLSSESSKMIGPQNEGHQLDALRLGHQVILAWGTHGEKYGADLQFLNRFSKVHFHVLGLTKNGFPRHPLYLPSSSKPIPFTPDMWRKA